MLEGVDTKESISFVEELINRQVLSLLLCYYLIPSGGIDPGAKNI